MKTFPIVSLLFYFCSFAHAVNSYKLICVCLRDNGDIMLLKSTGNDPSSSSSTPPSEYSFPEMESPGCHDHKYVINNMMHLGINGIVSKTLYYTSSEDRANGTRDKFFHIYVPPNYINMLPANSEWRNFTEVGQILQNHPNENYKLFLAYASKNPQILHLHKISGDYVANVSEMNKKILLMCTDPDGKVLFVRSELGRHVLPVKRLKFMFNHVKSHTNRRQLKGKAEVKRMLYKYGLVGCIYAQFGNNTITIENGCRNIETVFHVLVMTMNQNITGITNPNVPEAFDENSPYDPNYKLWLSPDSTRNVFAGTRYFQIYKTIYATKSDWPAVYDRLRAKYLQFRMEGNPPTYIEMNCIDDSDDESTIIIT